MLNDQIKNIIILIFLGLLPNIAIAEIAPSGMTEFNKTCPAQKLCSALEKYYQKCKEHQNSKSCSNFIKTMKKLSPIYDCQRPFDKTDKENYIVPAIWLCGNNKREDGIPYTDAYYELLFKLKSTEAREYFASPLFRSTLDGYYAEEYYDESEKMEKQLRKKE